MDCIIATHVVLLYAAKDELHNNAIVLKEWAEEKIKV